MTNRHSILICFCLFSSALEWINACWKWTIHFREIKARPKYFFVKLPNNLGASTNLIVINIYEKMNRNHSILKRMFQLWRYKSEKYFVNLFIKLRWMTPSDIDFIILKNIIGTFYENCHNMIEYKYRPWMTVFWGAQYHNFSKLFTKWKKNKRSVLNAKQIEFFFIILDR